MFSSGSGSLGSVQTQVLRVQNRTLRTLIPPVCNHYIPGLNQSTVPLSPCLFERQRRGQSWPVHRGGVFPAGDPRHVMLLRARDQQSHISGRVTNCW